MKDFVWQIVFGGVLLGVFLLVVKIVFVQSEYIHPEHNQYKTFTSEISEKPTSEEKSFVILVYSNNSGNWVNQNLYSVFRQNYSNYRVIYIDDASFDETPTSVSNYMEKEEKKDRFIMSRQEKKKGVLANYFQIIHDLCRDEEIIVLLDGKDWFAHPNVLQVLNRIYGHLAVWLTYGQYVIYPSYETGICCPLHHKTIKENGIRCHPWVCSHLKSFYAGLFKRIKLQDLLYKGKWIDRALEQAMMFPMLEMAQNHRVCLDEVLYVANYEKREEENVIWEDDVESVLRNYATYQPLSSPPYLYEKKGEESVDIVLFSFDRCMQLYACLESVEKNVIGTFEVTVIYRTTSEIFDQEYKKLKERFPKVHFIKQPDNAFENFKPIVIDTIFSPNNPAHYVMFGVDSHLIKDKLILDEAINMMKKTCAYGFYFRLGHDTMQWNCPSSIRLCDHIYGWEINMGEGEWNFPHDLDMTLYRKADIFQDFDEMSFKDPNDLKRLWAIRNLQDSRILGLCFDMTKTLHLSLYKNKIFLTPEDFQAMFERGLKIDINPIFHIDNQSSHIDRELEFVIR